MRRLVLRSYGKESGLVIEDTDRPVCEEGSVCIRVYAAGISFTDRIIFLGLYAHQKMHAPLPVVPGFECSGVVIDSKDPSFRVGDRVAAVTYYGSWAEEVCVPAVQCVHIPEAVSFVEATGSVVNVLTAWYAAERAHVRSGAHAVVTGASGGVGVHLLHELVSRGVSVTGVVGHEDKRQYVSGHGASHVLLRDDYYKKPVKADYIFLNDGVYTRKLVTRGLNPKGTIIVYGFHSLVQTKRNVLRQIFQYIQMRTINPFDLVYDSYTVQGFNILGFHTDTDLIRKGMSHVGGTLCKPFIHDVRYTEYGYTDAHRALADLDSGVHVGKCVLVFGCD